MKNKLIDLNNHLFCAIERLNDDELKGDELNQEINRAHAMTNVAAQIINNANLVLKATVAADNANGKLKMPLLLGE